MKISWLGHACFKIETKDTILIDPFSDSSVNGYTNIREQANLCICSHTHADHFGKENVEIIDKPLECKYTYINSFHDDQNGVLRGKNTITIIEDGTYKIAHLGDLGCDINDSRLYNLDLLMIPIGGFYTIDAKQAYTFIQKFNPKHVIPMHYRLNSFGYDELETLDSFTKYFKNIKYLDTNTFDLDCADSLIIIPKYEVKHD